MDNKKKTKQKKNGRMANGDAVFLVAIRPSGRPDGRNLERQRRSESGLAIHQHRTGSVSCRPRRYTWNRPINKKKKTKREPKKKKKKKLVHFDCAVDDRTRYF